MKKIILAAACGFVLTACGGETGQREHQMIDYQVEAPTSNPNGNDGLKDTSTPFTTQDTSTVIGYDTSVRRKN